MFMLRDHGSTHVTIRYFVFEGDMIALCRPFLHDAPLQSNCVMKCHISFCTQLSVALSVGLLLFPTDGGPSLPKLQLVKFIHRPMHDLPKPPDTVEGAFMLPKGINKEEGPMWL